jgi:hypothetical protein
MLEGETSSNHLPNVDDIALSLVGGEDNVIGLKLAYFNFD